MTKPADQDAKALLKILTDELNGAGETPEPGFRRRIDWQEIWGCSDAHAKRLLDAGIKAGLVEIRRYRVRYPSGYVTVPHYRAASGLKKAK